MNAGRAACLTLCAIVTWTSLAEAASLPTSRPVERPDATCSGSSKPIVLGVASDGRLSAQEVSATGAAALDSFEITLAAAQSVRIQVTPVEGGEAPRLAIGRCRGDGFQEFVFANGGGATARVGFTSPESALYTVRVSSNRPSSQSFKITVNQLNLDTPPVPEPIKVDQTLSYAWTDSSPRESLSGDRYIYYKFNAQAFERYKFDLAGDTSNLNLDIGLATTDDWSDGFVLDEVGPFRHAFKLSSTSLGFVAPRDGTYLIKIHSSVEIASASGSRQFDCTLSQPPIIPIPARLQAIRLGDALTDTIGSGDPAAIYQYGGDFGTARYYPTFQFYKAIRMKVKAGQKIEFSLNSDEFDTLLQIGYLFPLPRIFYPVAQNGDIVNRPDKNSRIELAFASDGEIVIRMVAAREGGHGQFTFSTKLMSGPN